MPALVPLKGVVGVTRFQIDARQFIGGARRIRVLLGVILRVERLLLVFPRLVCVVFEGIGDGHRPQRLNFRSRRGLINRLGQMLAGLLVLALQIQSHACRQVCLEEIWGELQGTIVKRQGLILLALAIQLLALFDELEGIVCSCARFALGGVACGCAHRKTLERNNAVTE